MAKAFLKFASYALALIKGINASYQSEWQYHVAVFKVTLTDGSTFAGEVMRRKVDGAWQYRLPTDEELNEQEAREAI